MTAPPDVPSAQFRGLHCEANYGLGPSSRKARNKRRTSKPPAVEPLKLLQHAEESSEKHTYSLRSNPKRSKKAKLAQEESGNAGSRQSMAQSTQLCDQRREDLESLAAEAIAEMAYLLDFAFSKLIGVKGVTRGLRTIHNAASPPLMDIAPAVWDLRYLQVTSRPPGDLSITG